MNKNSKIYVSGHNGLVGSAIVRRLEADGYKNLLLKSSGELDLRNQLSVNIFFQEYRPEFCFLVAGVVGGVKANNTRRAEFIYDNLMIEANVIHAAYRHGVKKLLFTGSSCLYPRYSPQPILEEYLLTGELEPTNEPYAIAKIAGIKMCQAYHAQYGCNFISAMPTNSYGLNDKYDLDNSHVLPALLKKIIIAKEKMLPTVELWGTGTPRREFIYSDDMAEALIFLMNNYDSPEIINIGTGNDITIRELAEIIKYAVGWQGQFIFNGELDGTMRKRLDVSKINLLGWAATTNITDGIIKTANDIYANKKHLTW